MKSIEIIYLKELSYYDEILKGDNIKIVKYIKIIFKKLIGAVTIKENGVATLPYKSLKRFRKIKIYFIKKVLEKLDVQVVLSKYLEETELKKELVNIKINVVQQYKLTNYLYYNIIEYICKIKKEDMVKQEVTVLVKRCTSLIQEQIIDLLNSTKRVKIVTPNIKEFEKLEIKAEQITGMPCQITNNKKKSLSKANIIINIDFDEKMINTYNINQNAIIINVNTKSKINYENHFKDIEYKKFDLKSLYASTIFNKNFGQIKEQVNKDKLKVVNLIGTKGIINIKEF